MPEYQPKLVTGGVTGAVLLNKPHHHSSLTERKSLLGFALDRSGSMSPLAGVALQSLNQLVDQQKTLSGDSCFTLTLFNNDVSLIHDAVALRDVPSLIPAQYEPNSGGTALNDALAHLIHSLGRHAQCDSVPGFVKRADEILSHMRQGLVQIRPLALRALARLDRIV